MDDQDCWAHSFENIKCYKMLKQCHYLTNELPCADKSECKTGDCSNHRCSEATCKMLGEECEKGLDCCGDSDEVSCLSNKCVSRSEITLTGLGEDCSEISRCPVPALGCKHGKCKSFNGYTCRVSDDCFHGLCCNSKCSNAEQFTGECKLKLGLACKRHEECDSGVCDERTRVCVGTKKNCDDVADCSSEPEILNAKKVCDDGTCNYCVNSGKQIIQDLKCCEPAISYEGKCLLGIGQACSDKSECISEKCDNGACAENVDNRTPATCYTDGECQKVNQNWRCCLRGSNMSSEVCNSDNLNKCVAWVVCGNNCCEGTEDERNCPRDCPQNPSDIPAWCTPNQPLLASGLTQAEECQRLCLHSRSCGGARVGQCNCNGPCNGAYCYNNRCQTALEICDQLCGNLSGLQPVATTDGTINCKCGSVSSEFSGPETLQVPVNICSSLWACRDESCPGKYKCCNKRNDGSFQPYGDCFGTVPVDEGSQQ